MLVGTTVAYFYLPIFTIEGEEGRKTPHQYVRYQFLETGKNLPKKTKSSWVGPEEKENSVPSGTENGRGEISTPKMAEENAVSLLGKIFHRILPRSFFQNPKKESREMWEAREKESLKQAALEQATREKGEKYFIVTRKLDEFEKLQMQARYLIENELKNANKFDNEKERMYQLIRLQSIQNQLHEKQKDLALEGLKEGLKEYLSPEKYNSFIERFDILYREQLFLNDYEMMAMPNPSVEKGINFFKDVAIYEKYEQEGNTQKFYNEYMDKISTFIPNKILFGQNFTKFKDEISSAENLQKEFAQRTKDKINLNSLAQEYQELEKAIQMLDHRKNQCQFSSMFSHVSKYTQEEIKNYEIRLTHLKKYLNPSYEAPPTTYHSIWEGGMDLDFFFQEELMNLFIQFHIFFPLFFILILKFFKKL